MPDEQEAGPTAVPESFDAFFEREHGDLFGALYLVTRDRHEAEDLMQEAFLKLWERWDRVGSLEDPTGYLYRTAMNAFRIRYLEHRGPLQARNVNCVHRGVRRCRSRGSSAYYVVQMVKNARGARVRLGGLSKSLAVAAAVGALVFLSSCAGEEPTAKGPAEPTAASPSPQATEEAEPECADLTGEATAQIRMVDFSFDPFCAIVSADQKIEFVNEGESRHSFTVPKLDLDVLTGESKTTPKPIGEFLESGTHTYACKYHGPMTGELRVE